MHCEQVFDILTRGPFPTGACHDTQVEAHLSHCHECRQLAEALRPATDLLHESLADTSNSNLPGYTGTWTAHTSGNLPATVALMLDQTKAPQPTAIQASARTTQPPRSKPWIAGVLATVAIILLFVWGWHNQTAPLQPHATETGDFATTQLNTAAELTPEGIRYLNQLQLPRSCSQPALQPNPSPPAESQATAWTQCCTRCHTSEHGRPSASPQLIAKMAASCRICHLATTEPPTSGSNEVSSAPIRGFRLSCNL